MTKSKFNSRAFAALGHEIRLSIFRLLVKAGDEGLCVNDIVAHLDIAPSTLAHHLGALVDAKIIVQEKRGREVLNIVDFEVINGVLDFLSEDCCLGVSKLSKTDAA